MRRRTRRQIVNRRARAREPLGAAQAQHKRSTSARTPSDAVKETRFVPAMPDCEHGKRRDNCRICCPSIRFRKVRRTRCEHGRRRSRCADCGGGEICQHGVQRYGCSRCRGGAICEHGRHRRICRDCGGSAFCSHGLRRELCRSCGGASICPHNRLRYYCGDCGGKGSCMHGRKVTACSECQENKCIFCEGRRFSTPQRLRGHILRYHSGNLTKSLPSRVEERVHKCVVDSGLVCFRQVYIPFSKCALASASRYALVDLVLSLIHI